MSLSKENQRNRTIKNYNLDLYDVLEADGIYEMPIIKKEDYIPDKLVGFNYAKTSKEYDSAIHFYLDDYQFERLWNNPDKYIDLFKKYECIFTPDFSLYMDMPLSMKIWNTYRSRLLGQYYQKNGIVSISTLGVKKNKDSLEYWKKGATEMIKQLKPSCILIYGEPIEFDFKNIRVKYFNNNVIKNIRKSGII